MGGYTQHFLFPSQSRLGGFLNDVGSQKTVVDLKGDVLKRLLLEKVVLWGGGRLVGRTVSWLLPSPPSLPFSLIFTILCDKSSCESFQPS